MQCEVGGQGGKMDLRGAALAVGVVEQETVARIVDDAVRCIGGGGADVNLAAASNPSEPRCVKRPSPSTILSTPTAKSVIRSTLDTGSSGL